MAGEWREIALWDIAEYINGRATKPSELASNGVPVIKIAELNRGITEETDRIPPELVEEKHWVSPGDLLFAWSGSVGIYRYAGPKAALNQHIFRVVAKPGIDQGFLRYLLLSCVPLFQLHVQDKRTTMGHVTKKDLQRIRVRIPPLQEQRAIAHILGTLDDKIELNRRMSQTLEAMARALFKAWFVDFEPVRAKMEGRWQRGQSLPGLPAHLYDLFPDRLVDSELGEIPEGWRVVSVYEVADVIYGAPFSSAQFNTEGVGEPLLRIRDLPSESPSVWTTEVHPKGYKVRPGDIVVGMDGEFRAYLWGGVEAWLNQRLCVFKPKAHYSTAFVRNAIIQPLADVEATETATTVIHLGKADIDQFRVVLPTPDVAGYFNTVCQRWYDRIVTSKQQSRTLAALRDALLPKLIRGEIRVKDAERFLKERGL
jgi:type I restriction enzyme S subunit